MPRNTKLVYSTDGGRVTDAPPVDTPPSGDGVVRIHRESKGRGGKGVSIIKGLGLPAGDLKTLANALKKRCGVGGAVKGWNIEIQGDQREVLKVELEKHGFQVRLSGG